MIYQLVNMKTEIRAIAIPLTKPIYATGIILFVPEVESRTKGSMPRTQKKSEAKDSPFEDRPSQGQGQECSRPRTQAQVFSKKKVFKIFFQAISKKKVFKFFFQAFSSKKRRPHFFSGDLQNFNNSKKRAVLKPRTGQFSRT